MKTDPLFYRLFKDLPETFFELVGQPVSEARHYRFEALELKQAAIRLDGLFLPLVGDGTRPVWFVEMQFYRNPKVYANLFSKVFRFLDLNDPDSPWRAAVVFGWKHLEPAAGDNYRALLESGLVHRVFLEDLPQRENASLGYRILRLVAADKAEALDRGTELVGQARQELADASKREEVVELIEAIILATFPRLTREELQAMLKLEDVRKSLIWQEAHEEGQEEGRVLGREEGRQIGRKEGREEGREEGRDEMLLRTVPLLLSLGMDVPAIAARLGISEKVVADFAQASPPENPS